MIVVILGVLLMFAGVGAVVAYGVRHMRGAFAPISARAPKSATPAPPPTFATPAAPSASVPDALPKLPEMLGTRPLIAAGMGATTFPEDARAPLPVFGSEPIWGTRAAPLTIVIFGDLECPYTRRAVRTLSALKLAFGDDIRLVWRHRPLSSHPQALGAARTLAGLALRRGPAAFFQVLRELVDDPAAPTPAVLARHLVEAGISDLRVPELERDGIKVVDVDLELSGQYALNSTPFLFVNGLRVEGNHAYAELRDLLLSERRSTVWALASGIAPRALYGERTRANLIGVGTNDLDRQCVPLGASPVEGAADAAVTIVEFSDFECPFCKRAEPTLKVLLARYPGKARVVWKNFPLPQHAHANAAANFALAARSAAGDSGFWKAHDALFAARSLDEAGLSAAALDTGLDRMRLLGAAHAKSYDAEIQADVALAEKLGVKGTPTFFVNGRRLSGAVPLAEFEGVLKVELAAAQRIVSHGVPRAGFYDWLCGFALSAGAGSQP